MEVEGAGVVLDQDPAPAGGSGGAQAGGKAGGAEPEEGVADGAAEEEEGAEEMVASEEAPEQVLCCRHVSRTCLQQMRHCHI